MDIFQIIVELGFPVAGAIAAGYFVFLTLKFILAGVLSSVKNVQGMIIRLEKRVSIMNNDVHKLDIKISHALGIQPNYDRISRARQEDQRMD